MRPVLGLLLACFAGAGAAAIPLPQMVGERWLRCRLFGRWGCRQIAGFVLEMLLGAFAAWVAGRAGGAGLRGEAILAAATLGAILPVLLGFRTGGGTGVFFGAILAVSLLPAVGTLFIAICLLALTRSPGGAAALAAACYPAGIWLLEHPGPLGVIGSAAAAFLVVWHHRAALRSV